MAAKKSKGHGKLSPTLKPGKMSELESKLYDMALASETPKWKGAIGIFIPVSGAITPEPIDFTRAKRLIGGGMVEPVYLPSGNLLIVDEEGLLKGMHVNEVASHSVGVHIAGPAVFVPKKYARKALS